MSIFDEEDEEDGECHWGPGHVRVLPRDLFSEAKLLKCLGKVVLALVDDMLQGIAYEHVDNDRGFLIRQDMSSGDLRCENLRFFHQRRMLDFHLPYGNQEPWPLICTLPLTDEEVSVFDDNGSFTPEFLQYLEA